MNRRGVNRVRGFISVPRRVNLLAVPNHLRNQKVKAMAKRKEFNLSEIIREYRKAHRGVKATDALAAIKKAHSDQKINDGTFKSTFYKLAGGGKRKVRRLKPSANGSGDHMTAALKFVRECGSLDTAKAQLAAVGHLLEVAREVD
jgi:hypothetical protein